MAFNVIKAWNNFLVREQNIHASYNMLEMIQADHARIHDGRMYIHSDKHTLAANTVHWTYMDLSSITAQLHLRNYGYNPTNGPCDIFLFKACSVSAVGSIKGVENLNQTSVNTSRLQIFEFPTVVVTGTQIDYHLIESSAGGPIKSVGGQGGSIVQEWDFDNTFKLLLGLVNSSGGAITYGQNLLWYET